MFSNRFRNHLLFAIRKETSTVRDVIPYHFLEKLGNHLSWLAYEFRRALEKSVKNPKTLTVLFTLLAMTTNALVFYPSYTWDCIVDSWTWLITRINWSSVRFILWMATEVTILGVGLRAFGRFSNPELMNKFLSPKHPPIPPIA